VTGVLVDSNIILDIILDDPNWADWSETALADAGQSSTLYINQIVYSEISIALKKLRNWNQHFEMSEFR
jgi:predicted nucleic acid-binding protein